MNVKSNKKLIEVALPLEVINEASAREKSIRHGHPSTLHLWWARRPLAAARAVIFAQMVDDPSAHPDIFPTPEKQEKERQRLFKIIENLVQWENTNNETVLQAARDEIWQSWRAACAENADHPQAKELFNRHILPAFHDPFAGGGALPLEAQRLGLEAYASDLNPIAVLINKAMIEIPPKFAGKPPVNPEAKRNIGHSGSWKGVSGLAEDVRYYGKWMCDEAERRIGNLYPKVEITAEMAKDRPDLKSLIGHKLTVITWLWARTVKSPNPAFRDVDVPLMGSFVLSRKGENGAYIKPIINQERKSYEMVVRLGNKPEGNKPEFDGTIDRNGGKCLMSGVPITYDYIRSEGKARRMGMRLMAVIAKNEGEKIYLSPIKEHEQLFNNIKYVEGPEGEIPKSALGIRVQLYGFNRYSELFNRRQTVMLCTLIQLIDDLKSLVSRHCDSEDYISAIQTYLALSIGRYADYGSTMTYWDDRSPSVQKTFGLPTLQMRLSYPEINPFADFSGNLPDIIYEETEILKYSISSFKTSYAYQQDATSEQGGRIAVMSTDPPYYDNIGYAALSDYFYIWLKAALKPVYPDLFSTILTPKDAELIAEPGRHQNKAAASRFFEEGFSRFAKRLRTNAHPGFPCTIYYAFKQSETDQESQGVASTGWEVFIKGLIDQGWQILGTWPLRTEQTGGLRLVGRNSLASSIILVCRPRQLDAKTITRREFISTLKTELPGALSLLQRGNIAPVDLEQAAIGPGMAIYSRYVKVVDAEGNPLSVRDALRLINQTLYEVLTEQEGDFDSDTRWALVWFEQFGFTEGEYGVAEQLSKSKNTSMEGMVSTGILTSKAGKVRLFEPSELPSDWDPEKDRRLTVWEMTHQLIRALDAGGESPAAELVSKLGSKAEIARELAYRLYTVCERKKRSVEAGLYNSLVKSWPEILRLAQEQDKLKPRQGQMI